MQNSPEDIEQQGRTTQKSQQQQLAVCFSWTKKIREKILTENECNKRNKQQQQGQQHEAAAATQAANNSINTNNRPQNRAKVVAVPRPHFQGCPFAGLRDFLDFPVQMMDA